MSYWLLEGARIVGPLTAEELVWRRRGDLDALVCRSPRPAGDRRAWKLANAFPELRELNDLLP